MAWIARLVTAFSLSMFLVLAAEAPSFAQSCNSNPNCAQDRTCQPGLFGGECRELKCNTNRDCPTSRRTCFGGVCQTGCSGNAQCGQGFLCQGRNQFRLGTCTPVPPPQPGSGLPPGHVPGEGQRCGRVNIGGIIKQLGCPDNLQCRNNRCQKLQVDLRREPFVQTLSSIILQLS